MKKEEKNPDLYRGCFLFNYVIVVSIFSIFLFLYGFFPVSINENKIAHRKDIPKFIDKTRIKVEDVYTPEIKKLILMVIDGLRYDFVVNNNGNDTIPITKSLLKSKVGCVYKTKVSVPTVTMPRIKSMTTGSLPNYIDVLLNLGATEILGDSLLRQLKDNGHKIIFYGDDTWLKLFPDIFYRYEGTTSFVVTDFIEVDNNVTKNLNSELEKNDWSIMILHYLGLDHIGHISGPFSPLIKPKLQEMDEIIGKIYSYVSKMNDNNESTLFLFCGDHGMRDSGGHGGATLEETLVPLVAIGQPCIDRSEEILQIDLASTLSVLLGLPIPMSNLGSVVTALMPNIEYSQKLFVLYYNAEQLFSKWHLIKGHMKTETYKKYQNAIKLHSAWLNTISKTNEMVQDIIEMYESVIIEMKHTLTSNLTKYDVQLMTLAILYLCQILFLLMLKNKEKSTLNHKIFFFNFLLSYIFWIILNYSLNEEIKVFLFSHVLDLNFIFVAIPSLSIMVVNCYLWSDQQFLISMPKNFFDLRILLPLANFLHAISFFSSSFVEEEHQTWYFYWITLVTFLAFKNILINHRKQFKLSVSLMFLMLGHRILRKLNSTGDQWAHLPDLADWLQNRNTKFLMSIFLLCSLLALISFDFFYEETGARALVLFLDGFIAVSIYLRHVSSGAVDMPDFFSYYKGTEIYIFWGLLTIYCIFSIYRYLFTIKFNARNVQILSILLIMKKWVIISCMLHRPYNVILLPAQLLQGVIIQKLCKNQQNLKDIRFYLYMWSGYAFYFYQGNSNSLATVDLAAGYVGLESYQPTLSFLFLAVNTFSAQILSLLMFLTDYLVENPLLSFEIILLLLKQYAFWRLIPMTFYTIIISFQRYHLFVWSVFSPKLIYESMYCVILFTVMLFLQLNFVLCKYSMKKTKNKK